MAWASSAVGETCGPCGVVQEQYDADLLAEGIAECVENPLLARSLAQSGRLRYETEFHPDAIGAKLMTLVREVAEL